MEFKDWYKEYPLGSYITLKYDSNICRSQIIEYELINSKIFMTAGIHTIIFDGSPSGLYLSKSEFNSFPTFNISKDEFIKTVNN